jgi:DNA-binding SARP family transcriptional activator
VAPWLGILGPLTGSGSVRQRTLLGLLALTPGVVVSRDSIVDVLWGDTPPASAANSLQVHVSRLRRVVPPGAIESAPGGYRLRVTDDELDLLLFRSLVCQAGVAGAEQACRLYAQADRLWRGPLLADLPALHAVPAAEGVRGERVMSVVAWADAAAQAGRHSEVVPALRELTGEQPWDEPLHARLMIALAGSGRRATALEVFADLRGRLADQLGAGS